MQLFRVRKLEKMVPRSPASWYVTKNSAAGLDKFWLVMGEPLFLFYSHAIDQVPRVLSRIVSLSPQNQTLASSVYTQDGNMEVS